MDNRKKIIEKLRLYYKVEADVLSEEEFNKLVDDGFVEYESAVVEVAPLFDEIGQFLCKKRRAKTNYRQIYSFNESLNNLFGKYENMWSDIRKEAKAIDEIKVDSESISAYSVATVIFAGFSIVTNKKYKEILGNRLGEIKKRIEYAGAVDVNFKQIINTDIETLDALIKNEELWMIDHESKFESTQKFIEIMNRTDKLKELLHNSIHESITRCLGEKNNITYDKNRVLHMFSMYKVCVELLACVHLWQLFFFDILDKEVRITKRMSIERLKIEQRDLADKIVKLNEKSDDSEYEKDIAGNAIVTPINLALLEDLNFLDGYIEATEWIDRLCSNRIIIGVDDNSRFYIICRNKIAA